MCCIGQFGEELIRPQPAFSITKGDLPSFPLGKYNCNNKLVAINTNNCTWVELEPLLSKQLHKLPTELDALVKVYLILHVLYSDVDAIGAGLVKRVDSVIHHCTEMVSESCWYPKMRKFADVFQIAAENNQAVRFS